MKYNLILVFEFRITMYIFVTKVQNFYRITVGLKDFVERNGIEEYNGKLNKEDMKIFGGEIYHI